MRFKKLSIKNYMGIPDISFAPGSLNLITGKNGYGKSSIIEAIRAVGSHDHDPARIRSDAEFAEVVIELDNGYVLKMRTRAKGTTWAFSDEKGHKIERSAEFLEAVVNSLSMDPIRFLDLKPVDQLKAYQAAQPLRLTAQDLAFVPAYALTGSDLDKHALDVIGDKKSGVYGKLYDQRTEYNRTADVAKKYAMKLAETLPADAPEGNWSDLYQAKSAELSELRASTATQTAEIRKDAELAQKAHEEVSAEFVKQQDKKLLDTEKKLEKELAEAIANLKADTEIARKIASDEYDSIVKADANRKAAAIASVIESRDAALEAAKATYTPKNESLIAEISQAKTMIDEHSKFEATRNLIDEQKHIEGDAVAKSDEITAMLEQLEQKRIELVAKSPIPGLEVKDGELFYNGVPYRIVNTAQRTILAAEICALSQGELSAVIIDNWERLDNEHQEGFKKWALSTGRQYIVAEKTQGELQIEAEKGAA